MRSVIATAPLSEERDVAQVRGRVVAFARALGIGPPDQTRFATAVSEISRLATRDRGGEIELAVVAGEGWAAIEAVIVCRLRDPEPGPASEIADPGIVLARRLVDRLEIDSNDGRTRITLQRRIMVAAPVDAATVARIREAIVVDRDANTLDVLRQQNLELLQAIDQLQQKEAELERARHEAEAAVLAKSVFLATMSHEIRTPMNAIVGLTELMGDTQLTLEQRDFLRTIRVSGQHLLHVINDILDFSKIESGKLTLSEMPFDLRACVEECMDLLAQRATEKGLAFTYRIAAGTPTGLVGDSGRLRQILVNYLSNAIKFTPAGSIRLTVDASRREDGRQDVHFAVEDSGPGIPADRLALLFQPFTQVDDASPLARTGTGLGLLISKRLAELMRGRVWVDSQVGAGSTFHVTIGCLVSDGASEGIERELAGLAGRTLLVVDDNWTNRRIVRGTVECWGMVVEDTGSPREAISWLAAGRRYDAALIDYNMPELNGVELAQRIHALAPGLPLVMSSSLRDPPEMDEIFAAVLLKPLHRSALRAALHGAMHGTRHGEMGGKAEPVGAEDDAVTWVASPLRILVAEDNLTNQKVVALMLRSLGYQADVVGDGAAAVRAVRATTYDLVLMDVHMPMMDGIEATREIRAALPLERRPRIVALTAGAFEEEREMCRAAGMDDFLAKPFDRVGLTRILKGLDGARADPARPVAFAAEIDAAAIAQLRTTLGMSGFAQVMEAFVRTLNDQGAALSAATAAGEPALLRLASHTLRGACGVVGAHALAARCLEVERALRAGDLVRAIALASEIRDRIGLVVHEVGALPGARGGIAGVSP